VRNDLTKAKASDDLLADLDDDAPEDLLTTIDDVDAEPWIPDTDGEGVQGKVVLLDSIPDDYKDGATVPVVVLESADGNLHRIVGYSTVLRKEIVAAAPRVGDTMAVKYFGERILKGGKFAGKPYKHYKVKVKRTEPLADGAPF
jgi:hypothetical protein